MSSIEERLVRDIAAVTGGVVVTDSDLQEARSAVIERIHVSQRRNRIRNIALAAAAAVVLVAGGVTTLLLLDDDDAATRPVGPAPSVNDPFADFLIGSAPTSALIEGVWRLNDGAVIVKFGQDGTVQFDEHGALFSQPVTTGTYTIVGDVITVITTQDEQSGCIGKKFAMRASLPEAGNLRFVPSATSTGPCSPLVVAQGNLEQLLPTRNKDVASLGFSEETGWHPLSGKAALYGVFLAHGGGHLLEMDRDGSYYVFAESGTTVDRGQWSLDRRDLTLTSSAASAECSNGDKLVLRAVEELNSGTNVFRGTVARNTCGAAWTPSEWILIPHEGS